MYIPHRFFFYTHPHGAISVAFLASITTPPALSPTRAFKMRLSFPGASFLSHQQTKDFSLQKPGCHLPLCCLLCLGEWCIRCPLFTPKAWVPATSPPSCLSANHFQSSTNTLLLKYPQSTPSFCLFCVTIVTTGQSLTRSPVGS